MADPPKRAVGSAVGRMLAVFDSRAAAEAAIEALTAAGFERSKVELFEGAPDAAVFDASGQRRGLRGRLYRLIEFSCLTSTPATLR